MVVPESVPEVDAEANPFQMFDALPFSTWQEGNLVQVLRYLRGNKSLRVPPQWLQVFPQPFEVLNSLEQQRKANQKA